MKFPAFEPIDLKTMLMFFRRGDLSFENQALIQTNPEKF